MPNGGEYQDRDEFEKRRRQAAISMKEKMQGGIFRLPEGDTTFRILKTPKGTKSPALYVEYYIHGGVGPKNRTLRCGKNVVTDQGDCWLCDDKIPELLEAGKEEKAKDLERRKTFAINIAVRDEATGTMRGPLFWPMGAGKSKKAVAWMIQPLIGNLKKDYLDHVNGYNFTINRIGTGFKDTTYGSPERDDEPSRVPKQIIAKLKPFEEILLKYDEKEMRQAYFGKDREDTVKKKRGYEEEEEEAPRRRIRDEEDEYEEEEAPPKKKKRPVEDEEEELNYGDEDDTPPPKKKKKPPVEEEEDEEEEAPRPKKKKRPVEEEEEVEDEEEDDTPPPKKKKRPVEEEEEEDDVPPPRKKKKPPVEEEEEEEEAPPPKKKKRPVEDEDEEEELPRRRVYKDEEEDEEEAPPPKKKKKPPVEEEEEEEEEAPPPKKKRRVVEEEDE